MLDFSHEVLRKGSCVEAFAFEAFLATISSCPSAPSCFRAAMQYITCTSDIVALWLLLAQTKQCFAHCSAVRSLVLVKMLPGMDIYIYQLRSVVQLMACADRIQPAASAMQEFQLLCAEKVDFRPPLFLLNMQDFSIACGGNKSIDLEVIIGSRVELLVVFV